MNNYPLSIIHSALASFLKYQATRSSARLKNYTLFTRCFAAFDRLNYTLYIINYPLNTIFLAYFADDSEIIVIFAADKGLKVSIMMLETSAEGPDQS